MPYCTNCGAQLTDNASFCSYCGQAVTGARAPAANSPAYTQPGQPASPTYSNPGPSYSGTGYEAPARPTFTTAPTVEPVSTTGLWIWSIITILLSLIPGAIAISMTRKINKCATVEEQRKKIKAARIWCIIGTVIGVLAIYGQVG